MKKKKKQDKEEIWNSNIGLLKKIPKHQTKYDFGVKDIFRLLLLFIVFSIPFIYWINIYAGLGIGLAFALLFEFSAIKKHMGLLEIIGTDKIWRLYNTGIWEKLHSILGYWFFLSIIISIIVILIWLGIV